VAKTIPAKSQSTITVPDDYPTVQEAINNANEGDTVFVKNGTYYEQVVVDKKLVSLIGENPETTIFDGNYTGDVMTIVSDNVSIKGFTIKHAANAISLYKWGYTIRDCRIFGNNLVNNSCGIYFSSYGYGPEWARHSIFGNNITDNGEGIRLGYDYDMNTIHGNRIVANSIGIRLTTSNNTISGNFIAENTEGISWTVDEPNGARDNRILENEMASNELGMFLDLGGGMLKESFMSTDPHGEVCHNSFAYNTNQVLLVDGESVWDNGCEGNYWSDYTGTDSDGDGIGDTPHIIDSLNQDNYPLLSPYMLGDINHDAIVDIFDCAKMGLAFSSTLIDLNWNPHCDVNEDGVIDIFDLVVVAVNFGKEWAPP
jgi:parallel beta-helix repeat protein